MHAILIRHTVSDYDKWKEAFDAHEAGRREMSATMHNLHQVHGDPNDVVVFVGVSDVEKALAAFGDEEMKKTMQEAGVTGEPTIQILENRGMALDPSESSAGMLFKHAVSDYDKFRAVFDEHDGIRQSEGAADGWSVNTLRDDGNMVVGYIRTSDLDKLQSFTQSEGLKDAMGNAGVTGAPEFTFLDHVEMKRYE